MTSKDDGFQALSTFLGDQIAKLNSLRVTAHSDANELYLFRWLVDQNFTVQRYPNNPGHKKWLVLDFDSEEITSGTSAIDAIQRAHDEFDNPSDEQIERNAAKYREEREAGRAEELADRRQSGELT